MKRYLPLLIACLALTTTDAYAQSSSSGLLTLVVPASPGGPSDVLARVLSEKLKVALGQNVVVENRGGANGTIGVMSVVRSNPDGRSILLAVDGPITTIPAMMPDIRYDALRDLVPVAVIADGGDVVLAVAANSAAGDAKDLVRLMKIDPDRANYVSSGGGFPSHVAAELFKREANFAAQHIPLRGSGAAVAELLSGRYSFGFVPASLAVAHVKGAKLRVLAVAGEKRNSLFADTPTMAEAAFAAVAPPGYWIALYVPAATPKPIVEKLAIETNAIVRSKDYGDLLKNQGMFATTSSTAEIQARLRKEIAFWNKTVNLLNIKME